MTPAMTPARVYDAVRELVETTDVSTVLEALGRVCTDYSRRIVRDMPQARIAVSWSRAGVLIDLARTKLPLVPGIREPGP